MTTYPVAKGRSPVGWWNGIERAALLARRANSSGLACSSPSKVEERQAPRTHPCSGRRWPIRGIQNPYLKALVADGKFQSGIAHVDRFRKLRLEEYRHLNSNIKKENKGLHTLEMLVQCSPRRPCGSMLCPSCRIARENQDLAWVEHAFQDVPDEHIFLESKLVAAIAAHIKITPPEAKGTIDKNRTDERRLIAKHLPQMSWLQDYRAFKIFEIEYYRSDELEHVYRQYRDGTLPKDEVTIDGLLWVEDFDWKKGYKPPQVSRRKIELLLALGWEPGSGKDFVLVHSHAIVSVSEPELYKELQKKLYPHNYQMLMLPMRKDKSRADNLRDMVHYLLKCAPRCGVLFTYKPKGPLLSGVELRRFCAIYNKLGYQGMKAHFNMPPRPALPKKVSA